MTETTIQRTVLAASCLATALLIPHELLLTGTLAWSAGVLILLRSSSEPFRRRMGILYACTAILAVAPINTNLETGHFITLGLAFALVVFGPTLLLRATGDSQVIDWRFWPTKWAWRDIVYTVISIPLAWSIIGAYFFIVNLYMPTHWPLPAVHDPEQVWRLIIGINCVGIWDELFFINTTYAILRSLYPKQFANLAQAVVYTSVLYDMAFTGIGPLVIYGFALTQGIMWERSRCLLFVLAVHVIVDVFLVMAILHYYYPGLPMPWI